MDEVWKEEKGAGREVINNRITKAIVTETMMLNSRNNSHNYNDNNNTYETTNIKISL